MTTPISCVAEQPECSWCEGVREPGEKCACTEQASSCSDKLEGITRRADTMSGRYCLAGTRMPVVQVKEMVADAGRDWVKREFPWITDAQMDTALAFRSTARQPLSQGSSNVIR